MAITTRMLTGGLALALGTVLSTSAIANDQAAGAVSYKIKQGESLYVIDQRYLRGEDATRTIARLNRIENPRRIPAGKVLKLPRNLLAFTPAQLKVQSFSGPVQINGRQPVPGTLLPEGAVVKTGKNGFVSLASVDGARVSLPSNSHAKLERSRIYRLNDLRDIEFRILSGRSNIKAPKLRQGERFRMRTPRAVTAVRGTEFRVGYDEASDLGVTEVVEGQVGVGNGSTTQLTNQGEGVSATAAGISAPEALLAAPVIADPGKIQTEENVSFGLSLPQGAVAARTQLARDAGFLDVVTENVDEAGATAQFSELEDGRYFVRSRAIAQSGLEGLSEVYTFRRKRLGAAGSAEASPLGDGFLFKWSSAGEGPVQFALQLWEEGNPDQLLVDELALSGTSTTLTGLTNGTYVWRVGAIQVDEGELLKIWGPMQKLNITE